VKKELTRTKIGTKETALTLGCSEKTLRNKLSAGSPDVPPHYQIFGRRLWDVEELENWLRQRRVENEPVAV
jgi:hypothetical protein